MAPKLTYHPPKLRRLQALVIGHIAMSESSQSATCDLRFHWSNILQLRIMTSVFEVANVEQWQRVEGRWTRLDFAAYPSGERVLLPLYMIDLANLIEQCR